MDTIGNFTVKTLVDFPFILIDSDRFDLFYIWTCCLQFLTPFLISLRILSGYGLGSGGAFAVIINASKTE